MTEFIHNNPLIFNWFNLSVAAILLTGTVQHLRALARIDREERAQWDRYREPSRWWGKR